MKMRVYFYSIVSLLLFLLAGCATTTDPADAYKGESPEQIFQKGEEAMRDKSYGEAIKRFEALDVQYPFGRDTEIAQLHIIYAYYKNSDYVSAEAAADRFIHAHPTSPHVDYAYLMRGLSNYYQNIGVFERLFTVDLATRDPAQLKKSFADFSELTTRFPNSVYTPEAHQYMIYLRNLLANHQLEVAQFYFEHKAYIAAANRASLVVRHYQGAPAVPYALVIMAKSYQSLHMNDLANRTIAVIQYNYPNSIYLKAVINEPADRFKLVTTSEKDKALAVVAPQPKSEGFAPPERQKEALNKIYNPNGTRDSGKSSFMGLIDELNHSGFFGLHSSKPAVSTEGQQVGSAAPASESPRQPVASAPTTVASAASDQTQQPQQPASAINRYPFRANGDR
jgi:outer membrane protein assembly factor BamD